MRFTLRTGFWALSILAVVLAIGLWTTQGYRERLAIRAWLLSEGASYAHVGPNRSIHMLITKPLKSNAFSSLEKVKKIEFKGVTLEDGSLQRLSTLQEAEVIMFTLCKLDQPKPLQPLTKIGATKTLLFWNTPIDDSAIDIIANVPGLESIDFQGTKVSLSGANRLRQLRPQLKVSLRP